MKVAFLTLLLLPALATAADPLVVIVDSIEVQTMIDFYGRPTSTQVWYLDWTEQRNGGEIELLPVSRGWRPLSGRYPIITHEFVIDSHRGNDDRIYTVIAPQIGFSSGGDDAEIRARQIGCYWPIGGP